MSAAWPEIERAYFQANRAIRAFAGEVTSVEWARLMAEHKIAEQRYNAWRPAVRKPVCPTCGRPVVTQKAGDAR